MNEVDAYVARKAAWSETLERLVAIIREFEMDEALKWGVPYWSVEGRRVLGLAAFKKWVALWFEQGHAMADPCGVLVNAQPGKTKFLRQWRISDPSTLSDDDVRAYVAEAIRVTKA